MLPFNELIYVILLVAHVLVAQFASLLSIHVGISGCVLVVPAELPLGQRCGAGSLAELQASIRKVCDVTTLPQHSELTEHHCWEAWSDSEVWLYVHQGVSEQSSMTLLLFGSTVTVFKTYASFTVFKT